MIPSQILDLAQEASLEAIKEAGLDMKDVDALIVGNMLSDTLSNQGQLGSLIAGSLGLLSVLD